jgi:predicted  nucleic acid-binding Zn-ribbon protein
MLKEELWNLYKLQELQDRCEMLKEALKSHPDLKHLYKLKKDTNEMQAKLREKNKRIHNLENELLHMEQIIHDSYIAIKHVEERIYSGEVTTVKELKILEEKRNSALLKVGEYEEKALKAMEELDNLKTDLPLEIKLTNQKKTQYREKQLKINEEIGKIKTELTSLKKQLQQLETSISPKLLEKFYKIKKFKRHPVAYITEGKCNGCMMEVSVMVTSEVEQHKRLIYCENCGRILV